MRNKNSFESLFTAFLVILIFSLLPGCANEGKNILEKHFQEIGGKENLKNLKFITKTGIYYLFRDGVEFKGEYKLQIVYPDQLRLYINTPGITQLEVYNKGKGWIWDQYSHDLVQLGEDELGFLKRDAMYAEKDLAFYDDKFKKIKAVSQKDDAKLLKVIAKNRDNKEEFLWFSNDSNLLYSREKGYYERIFKKYVRFGNIFFPTIIEQFKEGRLTQRIVITEIDLVTPPHKSAFLEPTIDDIPEESRKTSMDKAVDFFGKKREVSPEKEKGQPPKQK